MQVYSLPLDKISDTKYQENRFLIVLKTKASSTNQNQHELEDHLGFQFICHLKYALHAEF